MAVPCRACGRPAEAVIRTWGDPTIHKYCHKDRSVPSCEVPSDRATAHRWEQEEEGPGGGLRQMTVEEFLAIRRATGKDDPPGIRIEL